MCQYCENLFIGVPDSISEFQVRINEVPMVKVKTYLTTDMLDRPYIRTTMSNVNGYVLESEMTKIQYCPMCGQKLIREP